MKKNTFGACEECEESAGVAPPEPVPRLHQTLVLRLGEQPGDEVGPHVGEAGVGHVPGYYHIGPVSFTQRKWGINRLQSENIIKNFVLLSSKNIKSKIRNILSKFDFHKWI